MSKLTDGERATLTYEYRTAILANDFDAETRLWKIAEDDGALIAMFEGVHTDILATMDDEGFIPATIPPTM